ncbi:energy transducer TonB [Geotalea toluenoxydans]
MAQALEVMPPSLQPRRHQAFRLTVVLSILLHLTVFAGLTGSKYGRVGEKNIAFLDMTMSYPAASPEASASVFRDTHSAIPQQIPARAISDPSELSYMQEKIEKNLQASGSASAIQQVSVGLGATRGYFRSLGDGETLREDIQAYYFELLQNINEKWWLDKDIDRMGIKEVVMNIVIARDGTIVAKELVHSSGNTGYDKAVLKALAGAGSLPPLPETYNGDFFLAPIRLVAPLNLLAS